MTEQRTINEIRERATNLTNNLPSIAHPKARERIKIEITTLNCYLANPGMSLVDAINKSTGEKQLTYRWIKGEVA